VHELHDPVMMKMIAEHNESQGEKTFDEDYDSLLVKWYRSAASYGETADLGESTQA